MSFMQYISRPGGETSVFDSGQLSRLKQGVKEGANAPLAEQKKVAQQFEALFIQQLIKQARQSSTIQGMFESDQTRLAQSMSDEQMALQLADPGIGLARALLDQIQAKQGGTAGGVSGAQGSPANLPELSASRLPGLRSRIGVDRKDDAPSISALIDLLSNNPITGAIFSAIKGAPEHIQDFVSKMSEAAKVAANESGVPAKLILSQAALESGWGKREIRADDGSSSFNLFGIKATSNWKGKVVNVLTTEYEDGVARKIMQPFRAYGSYAESFTDYARLIGQSQRYQNVVAAPTAEAAAQRIQEAGYATDPNYAQKLISIMGYFDPGSI